VDEELVPRDEARAALEARRELGAEYEDDLVERFAERIEARLKARPSTVAGLDHQQKTGIVIVSIIAAIPLIAIASGSGLAAVIAVCVALVAVNALVLKR
jgi:hypothetical protein